MNMTGSDLIVNSVYPAQPAQALQGNYNAPVTIASSPNSSPSVLEGLARVCSTAVLEHIGVNPNTPPSILNMVASHPNIDVKVSVAENRNTPLETLWILVIDENPDVRYQLAENHQLPMNILKALSEDDNPYVACRAQRTISRVQAIKPVAAASVNWKTFRRMELCRRMDEIRQAEESRPIAVVNRLFTSLYRYARAI
jgi:hypothetical protein